VFIIFQLIAKFKAGTINDIPANTGKDNNNKIAVTYILHTNNGNLCIPIPEVLMLFTVTIKLIAPNKDETPARWRLKIAKSTAAPECDCILDNGGYNVQPVPAPFSTNELRSSKINEGGNNQNEILFNRGNAISGLPTCKGNRKLPKEPTRPGITIKKIMTNAWAEIITLNNWLSPAKNWTPGADNSNLIRTENAVPIIPAKIEKIK